MKAYDGDKKPRVIWLLPHNREESPVESGWLRSF